MMMGTEDLSSGIYLSRDAQDEQPALFTPDQLATLTSDTDQLIGGLISPLSGNLSLQQQDFTVIGAQNIPVRRTYIAPYMPHLFLIHFD